MFLADPAAAAFSNRDLLPAFSQMPQRQAFPPIYPTGGHRPKMTGIDFLFHRLCALEMELQRPETWRDEALVNTLLHQEFEEVGRSGRKYSRADIVVARLSDALAFDNVESVESDEYIMTILGPDAALLTYRTAHRQGNGQLAKHAFRSSLWVRTTGDLWQIRYHQGTAASEG